MTADLLTTWEKLKKQAVSAEMDALDRLVTVYGMGYTVVDQRMLILTEQIEALQAKSAVTAAQIRKTAAFAALMTAIENELDDVSAYMRTEIRVQAEAAARLGLKHETDLLYAALAMAFGVEMTDIPRGSVVSTTPDALDFLTVYLNPNGALFGKIDALSGYHASIISDGILERVASGMNPRRIASWATDTYGIGLTDSMRMMRTAQLYSYRNAASAMQKANEDVLQGGVWCAELDGDCCMSCVAMHGQEFPVGEVCNDHHGGRCTILPLAKGMDNPLEQTGEAWFGEQDEAMQRSMMGDSKWEAWNDNKFDFARLSKDYADDVYGVMRSETPLKDLIGE